MRRVLAAWMAGLSLATMGLAQTATLENQGLRLELQRSDAAIKLIDKGTGVVWAIGSPQVVMEDGRAQPVRPAGEHRADQGDR